MANLDTRSKRASSVNLLKPYQLALVLPDSTISQGDRQHSAWAYSGIAAQAPILIMVESYLVRMIVAAAGEVILQPTVGKSMLMTTTGDVLLEPTVGKAKVILTPSSEVKIQDVLREG